MKKEKKEELEFYESEGESGVNGTSYISFDLDPEEIKKQMRKVIECMWESNLPTAISMFHTLIKHNIEAKEPISKMLKHATEDELRTMLLNYKSIKFIFTNKSLGFVDFSSGHIYHGFFDNSSLDLSEFYGSSDINNDIIIVGWFDILKSKIKRFFRRRTN